MFNRQVQKASYPFLRMYTPSLSLFAPCPNTCPNSCQTGSMCEQRLYQMTPFQQMFVRKSLRINRRVKKARLEKVQKESSFNKSESK